jgi:hypothetical protein
MLPKSLRSHDLRWPVVTDSHKHLENDFEGNTRDSYFFFQFKQQTKKKKSPWYASPSRPAVKLRKQNKARTLEKKNFFFQKSNEEIPLFQNESPQILKCRQVRFHV